MSDPELRARYGFSDSEVDGLPFASLREADVAEVIGEESAAARGGWVITPNVDMLYLRRHDDRFEGLLHEATLLVADGAPIIVASRLAKRALPERVCGSDLLVSVSDAAARRGVSVFLLGGSPGSANAAAARLVAKFPELTVAGTYCPPLGFESDAAELSSLQETLASACPNIVFVALGTPKQEFLISELRQQLPSVWWLGVGAAFSMLAGDVSRAPKWVGKIGLEWVWRLAQEPDRLFVRYVLHDAPTAVAVLARSVATRGVRRPD